MTVTSTVRDDDENMRSSQFTREGVGAIATHRRSGADLATRCLLCIDLLLHARTAAQTDRAYIRHTMSCVHCTIIARRSLSPLAAPKVDERCSTLYTLCRAFRRFALSRSASAFSTPVMAVALRSWPQQPEIMLPADARPRGRGRVVLHLPIDAVEPARVLRRLVVGTY
mgnify:CR=1 FL=1